MHNLMQQCNLLKFP